MTAGQGLIASLVTAGLVTTASRHSLPTRTTHIRVGSRLGVGAVAHHARWRQVGGIHLAWVEPAS